MRTPPLFNKNTLAGMTALLFATILQANASTPNSSIGKGILLYDKDAGIKDECIKMDEAKYSDEAVRITQYSLNLIKTKEELMDKITFSASAGGSYGLFSASAKSSFMREINWNYNSSYILVKASRISNKQVLSIANPLLKERALNTLRDSRFNFLESCGNAFTTSVAMGGEIYGLIEIKANNYEEKQHIENTISGSGSFTGGSASGKVNYEQTIQKLSSQYQLKIDFQHIGGAEIIVPNTVEGLLDISNKIEELSDSHPVPIAVNTRDYNTLSNYFVNGNDPELKVRQNELDWANGKLKLSRNIYSQILFILNNPKNFKRFNEEELKQKLTYLDGKIVELKNLIIRGYSFTNELDLSKFVLNLEVNLPEKTNRSERNGLPLKCEIKRSEICGVESYRIQNSSACGVIAPKESTGPTCGTVYKLAASASCGIKNYNIGRAAVCGVALYQKCYHGQSHYGRPREHSRDSSCGVELYNNCRSSEFGVEEYNTCRHPSNGIEKYETCRHKDFGYEFESCSHFSHGPGTYNACEVTTIGNQEANCPKF